MATSRKSFIYFIKCTFFTLVFPLAFFSLVCSQSLGVVHVVFSSVFALFRFWSLDHKVKIFSFLFTFFLTFPHFHFFIFIFFPFCFFLLSLLSCCCFIILMCLVLPWVATLSHCLLVSSLRCFVALSHCFVASLRFFIPLLCCFIVLLHCLVTLLCYFVALPRCLIACLSSHLKYLLIPPTPFLVSLPCCFTTLCWFVLLSSLFFCREELGA